MFSPWKDPCPEQFYHILFKPRMMVENYSQGFRKYYSSPGKALLFALTIAALHLAFVNERILGVQLNVNTLAPQLSLYLFFLPLLTLTSYITFIRREKGLAKHLTSLIYFSSAFFIVLTVLDDISTLLLDRILDGFVFPAYFLLILGWNAWVFSHERSWGFYFLHLLFEIIIASAIIALFILLIYLGSPPGTVTF